MVRWGGWQGINCVEYASRPVLPRRTTKSKTNWLTRRRADNDTLARAKGTERGELKLVERKGEERSEERVWDHPARRRRHGLAQQVDGRGCADHFVEFGRVIA